jgi:hypothetical protein
MKKFGFASFWNPAKRNVTPKKIRSGRSAHSESAPASDGAVNGKRFALVLDEVDFDMRTFCHRASASLYKSPQPLDNLYEAE